jgi:hypothetical protein
MWRGESWSERSEEEETDWRSGEESRVGAVDVGDLQGYPGESERNQLA